MEVTSEFHADCVHVLLSIKEFRRQGNYITIDEHHLPASAQARYIRFHPTDRHNYNCLRVEVYGTKSELITETFHISPLHMLMFYCSGKHLLNTA